MFKGEKIRKRTDVLYLPFIGNTLQKYVFEIYQ